MVIDANTVVLFLAAVLVVGVVVIALRGD